jgi:hypothetical protein
MAKLAFCFQFVVAVPPALLLPADLEAYRHHTCQRD